MKPKRCRRCLNVPVVAHWSLDEGGGPHDLVQVICVPRCTQYATVSNVDEGLAIAAWNAMQAPAKRQAKK